MVSWIKNKEQSYEVFDSFAVITIRNTAWRWSNKLFNNFSLKTIKLSTLQKLKSNLFHSITLDEKKNYFEKVMFSMKQSNFICIPGIIIQFFCWHQIETVNVFILFFISYKISKVSCTNVDAGGISSLIHGKVFLLMIL